MKVAAYCRANSRSTAQKDSLLRQINSYIERIINHPDWEFAGIYYDFGKSRLVVQVIGEEQNEERFCGDAEHVWKRVKKRASIHLL